MKKRMFTEENVEKHLTTQYVYSILYSDGTVKYFLKLLRKRVNNCAMRSLFHEKMRGAAAKSLVSWRVTEYLCGSDLTGAPKLRRWK